MDCAASVSRYSESIGSFALEEISQHPAVFSVIIIEVMESLEAFKELRVKSLPKSRRQLPFVSSVGVKVLGRSVRLEKESVEN